MSMDLMVRWRPTLAPTFTCMTGSEPGAPKSTIRVRSKEYFRACHSAKIEMVGYLRHCNNAGRQIVYLCSHAFFSHAPSSCATSSRSSTHPKNKFAVSGWEICSRFVMQLVCRVS